MMSEKVKCGNIIKENAPEEVIEFMVQEDDFLEDEKHLFEEGTISDMTKAQTLSRFYKFLKEE